jgi:hypothetical protein
MFHRVTTDMDEQGKPTGGFLIPNNVPIEDIRAMFEAGNIEIIYLNESDLEGLDLSKVRDITRIKVEVKDVSA